METGNHFRSNKKSFVKLTTFHVWFIANILLWSWPIPIGGFGALRVNAILSFLAFVLWAPKILQKASRAYVYVVCAMLCGFVISLGVAKYGVCSDGFGKGVVSAIVLSLIFSIGIWHGMNFNFAKFQNLETVIECCLVATIMACLIEAVFPLQVNAIKAGIMGGDLSQGPLAFFKEFRYSGIYAEPSHLAITTMPLLAFLWASSRKKVKVRAWIYFVVLFLLARNSTMMALFLIWCLYLVFSLRRISYFIGVCLGVSFIVLCGFYLKDYVFVASFLDRISSVMDGGANMNLSSAVYLQGWQDAFENLSRTHGMGLGINMMGCSPLPAVSIRIYLASFGMEKLNSIDGSFCASKLLSEFGVIGAVILVAMIATSVMLIQKCNIKNDSYSSALRQISAINYMIVFSFFVRSTVYFQGTIIIYVFIYPMCIRLLKLAGSGNVISLKNSIWRKVENGGR